ncbi:hypothetical protein [Spirosoma utsteinense]|uniref:Uncharacterized protein n=1 Tax=Spirosoma utsteinense TaxID=2585773 RepID=A0ABR6WBC4_9BACT|nr:hypothetical protein [Spirosoma utsteinense]MBC3785320.1 hypothetical protein [Spirosoma utsteinense]MBC3793876.1 hypothetical protein [Spirosoma utsteinense]
MKRIETVDVAVSTQETDPESKRLQLLQSHVQEWKTHYGLEKQAVEELEVDHQNLLVQLDRVWSMKKSALLFSKDQQVHTVLNKYRVRRELIWERQQAELEACLRYRPM